MATRQAVLPVFQAGGAVPSLHDCLGHFRRVKAMPLRGRYTSLETSAMAPGRQLWGARREVGHAKARRAKGSKLAGHRPDLCTDVKLLPGRVPSSSLFDDLVCPQHVSLLAVTLSGH